MNSLPGLNGVANKITGVGLVVKSLQKKLLATVIMHEFGHILSLGDNFNGRGLMRESYDETAKSVQDNKLDATERFIIWNYLGRYSTGNYQLETNKINRISSLQDLIKKNNAN